MPGGTEAFEQAEGAMDHILTLAIEIVADKEISKKSRPYAKSYTMQLLNTTFELKGTQHDDREDDVYLQDPNDSEEPLLPPQDNIAHKLGYNRDQLVAKFHQPKIETASFKLDEEVRSRMSLSKHDMMSSKGKRSGKNATPKNNSRLTNEEKELLKLQKMESFLKERMRPAA